MSFLIRFLFEFMLAAVRIQREGMESALITFLSVI